MKILFVMPRFAPGGAEKSLLMLLNSLVKREEVEVDLLLFKKEGAFINMLPEGVNVLEQENSLKVAYSNFSLRNFSSLRTVAVSFIRPFASFFSSVFATNPNHKTQIRWKYFYRHIIRTFNKCYDVACGYLDGESVYYVVDKVKADKKIGWNQNDYVGLGFNDKYDRDYYDCLDNIVTISDKCDSILKDIFPEYENKMALIPPLVSKSYIEDCSRKYNPEEFCDYTGYKLVSVGRLHEQKNFELAIKASVILKKRNIDFRWYIIGDGELREELTKLINDLKVKDTVILLGENSNPYPYIKGCDIFIQPSKYEGKSVVLNEAKMLEVPIIVTDYATAKDQITDEYDGLIAKMDEEDLAYHIELLLKDRDLKEKLVHNLSSADYDNSDIENKYFDLFGL